MVCIANAESQVNVDATISIPIKTKLDNDEVSLHIFDEARKCVFQLIVRNYLIPFLESATYKEAVHKVKFGDVQRCDMEIFILDPASSKIFMVSYSFIYVYHMMNSSSVYEH